jgi:hypothetical protein
MFQQQFRTVADHIPDQCLEWAGDPTGDMYRWVTEVLENCFSDQCLEAASTHNWREAPSLLGNPCRSLPPASATWFTMPTHAFDDGIRGGRHKMMIATLWGQEGLQQGPLAGGSWHSNQNSPGSSIRH